MPSYVHGDVTLAQLERAVDAGQPPIVDLQAWRDVEHPWTEVWDAGHYAILVGYDAEHLFFMDPSVLTAAAYAYMPRGELDERWHDLAGPGQPPAGAHDRLRPRRAASLAPAGRRAGERTRHGDAARLSAMGGTALATVRAQPTAVETLRRALASGRVHHAYLFDGPDGVGKERAAFGLAQALVCEKRQAGEANACGTCSACARAVPREGERRPVHPDVIVLERGLYEPARSAGAHRRRRTSASTRCARWSWRGRRSRRTKGGRRCSSSGGPRS